MPLFRYKALSTVGETLEGQMEATSADEVIVRLQEQGHLPVEARRADEDGAGVGWTPPWRRKEFDEEQVLQFTQQLATLLGAGQPLDRALGILLELPETAQAKRVVERIREAVRGGTPLSTALEQQHGVFSRTWSARAKPAATCTNPWAGWPITSSATPNCAAGWSMRSSTR